MKTVLVNASKSYEVLIDRGLLAELGTQFRRVSQGQTAVIVSDSHVWPLYGQQAAAQIQSAGARCLSFVFPAGEESKNGTTYLRLLNYLAENRLTRADCLIALGGGVTGDLTGFAAATFLRGIPFIQIPTTLLAAVDSSVGGKTAIDLPAGKNLAGAFYQPSLVLCDLDTLDTLPEDIFRDGCAEVIKYGVLYDSDLFAHLQKQGLGFAREDVIARCIELKRDVVIRDEFDRGERQKLNLGHTVGHGVEACSGFTVSHGKGVAIGMAVIARAAYHYGFCGKDTADIIVSTLDAFGLPTSTEFDAAALASAALSDKKRAGGTLHLIIPEKIGDCRIVPTPIDKLEALMKAGL